MVRRTLYLTRTSEPQPYDDVLFCGICGSEVYVIRSSIPTSDQSPDVVEEAVRGHLASRHRRRLWLYDRTGWKWLGAGFARWKWLVS